MKHTKRILAAILALVLLLTPMVSVSAAKTDAQTDTIVYFDLEAFLAKLPTSQIQYDYFKLATALQGLANREKPQLFFHMRDNSLAVGRGYDIDSYWFEKITDPELGYGELADGGDLANYEVDKVGSIWTLLDRFSDCYNGFVLWDEDVPSTANVASTIAGCENLLPVRNATGGFDLYTALMSKGFKKDDIKRDLTGLFSGEGYIPTLGSSVPGAKIEYTSTPSTQSQKTDPYIWAKMFYLDTGLTHPLHMTYSIDARTDRKSDWNAESSYSKPALAGELISAKIPSVMGLGEVCAISLTYQNTGTETWSEDTYDRFAINLIDGPVRLANKDDGSNSDSGDGNRLKLGKDVAPGETYTVTGYLVAPRIANDYTFNMFMNREGHGNISTNLTVNITVEKGGEASNRAPYTPYTPYEVIEQETVAKDAAIIKAGVDATVAPNASGTAQVVVKNTGTEAWPAGSTYALQYKIGAAAAATISLPTAVDPGQNVSLTVPYTAPASGTFDIALQMISGGEKIGADYTCTVNVEDTTSASALAAEIVSVSCPKSLTAGAKAEVIVEVLNSGSAAWTDAVKLVDVSSKRYMSGEGVADDANALVNEIALESGVTVEPGDTYRFHFDLHSYTNNGTKKSYLEPKQLASVELQVKSGSAAISDTRKVSYEIIDVCDTPVTVYAKTSDYKLTTYEYNARFISAAMPTSMNVNELVPVQFTLMNIGTATWENINAGRGYMRMAFRGAQNGFGFVTDPVAGTGDVRDLNRINITNGVVVEPGDTYTYTAYLKAPAEAGIYDVRLDGLRDVPTTWATADKTFTVTVVDPANLSLSEAAEAQLFELEPPMLELEPQLVAENNIIFHETADVTTEQYKATIMSAVLPETVKPGEKVAVSFTVKNTGTATFKSHLNAPNQNESLRIGFVTQNVVGYYKANDTLDANGYMAKKFSVLCDSTTRKLNGSPWEGAANGEYSRMDMLNGKTVASGDTYTFTGHLVTPTTPGTYEFEIIALADVAGAGSKSWWSTKEKITIKVVDPNAEPEVEDNIIFRESADVTTEQYKAAIMGAKVPLQVDPGEKFDVSFTVKNIGTETFKSKLNVAATTAEDCLRLAFLGSATQFNSETRPNLQPTSILDANGRMKDKFFVLCNSTTTKFAESPWAGAANGEYTRMDIKNKETIASGALYNFTGSFVAPTTEGVYKIQVRALREGTNGYRSDPVEIEITVGEPKVENNVIFRESADVTTEPYKAAIMGAKLPLQVDPGEKFDVSFTVKNIGTETFKSKLNVAATTAEDCLRLAFLGAATQFNSANKPSLQPTSILDANGRMKDKFFILCDSTTNKANESPWEGAANGEYTRMDIKNKETIASGALYNFTGSFVAPTTEGVYKIPVIALREGGSAGYRSERVELEITVGEPETYKPTEPEYTTRERDADILVATMPDLFAGETGKLTVLVKNTGTETWTQTAKDEEGFYLRMSIGSEKIYVPVPKDIAPGESVQFVCDYTAPDRETTRAVTAQMVYRNAKELSKSFGEKVTDELVIELNTGARAAEILSVQYSESLRESTKGTLMVEVLNTGAITWGGNNKIVLSELNDKAYLSAPGTADDDATSSTISIEPGVQVAPGERYVFVADLHTWTMYKGQRDYVMPNNNLELTLQLDAISGESTGKFGDEIATSTKITTVEYKPDVVVDEDPDGYPVTNEIQKAVLVYAEMPTKMAPGQLMPVKLTFKNIGQTEWYATDPMTTINCVRLRCDTYGPFDMCSNFEGTAGWTANRDRVNMADSTKNDHVMPGETYTYEFYLKAPTNPGSYTFKAYLINDSVKGQGGFEETTYGVDFPIRVGTQSVMEEEEFATSKAIYNDLMLTAVGNADYYIMHKAFFWDLAMDETIAPLDDRSQPVGTDVKVLRQLLDSQRKRAQAYEEGKDPWNKVSGVGEGYGIFQVGGFLPWYSKYCKDSDTQSKFSAAQQEWQQMMHISEYGGGSDADAYGTVTISNCSVYSKLKNNVPKFSKNVTQAQPDFDPAVGDPTVKYDPDKTYLLWHMGDWDGSAWTANIMPILMESDPRRGEIPVGWAVAAGNSLRIPHVFNWLYDIATPNDYFIAGDNGINYYDPNMNSRPHTEITGVTKEMGLEILDDFVAYNQYFNDIFSMDICGLLHTAGSGPSDDVVREAMSQMFPYGVGVTQEGANTKMEDCGIFVGADGKTTPFIPSYVFTSTSDGTLKTTVESLGANLANRIKSGPQFQVLRTVKVKVTSLIEIMEAMEAANPGIDKMYEVVDPYTFMRLAKEANGGFLARGGATYDVSRAGTVTIDGTMAQGEWTAAKQMLVSPTSEEIAKHGNNWNVTTLATDADMTTKFRVMWDNNYVYVAENRTDNGHISTAKTDGIDWTADSGALYISTDGEKLGSAYNKGDNAVIFNIGEDGQPNVWIRQGGEGGVRTERKMNAGEYVAAVKQGTDGNYVFEIAIPWSVLGDFRPAYGKTVGLAVLAIDGDPGLVGGGRQIMWGGAGDNQASWADATFK